jgi:transcription antitermination factor NusA-like protein
MTSAKQEKNKRDLGLSELSRYLGVNKNTVLKKIRQENIDLIEKDGNLFCPLQDLDKIVKIFISPQEISQITEKMLDDYGSLFKRLS